MNRYSKVENVKNKREVLLLKGKPCMYSKCAFCNYILDNTEDEEEINRINIPLIEKVTGEYGVLEIINSGSIFEVTKETLKKIKEKVIEKNIKVLYFEAYFGYIKRLNEIREYFKDIDIRFLIGIETFDNEYRIKVLKKRFYVNDKILKRIKEEYYGILLMICTNGQTKDQILKDIEIAKNNFNHITISIFVNNSTKIKRDERLVEWFIKEIYPNLKNDSRFEILIDNKDLGVYVQ